jgi:predicted membrane chloride channel (bestrophin family)
LAPSAKGRSTAYYSFEGKPSSPGWKTGQLDTLTDWAVADAANRAVICEYAPDGLWLWTKWRGTVLKLVILPVLLNMCLCAAIVYYGEMHVEDVLVQDLLEGVHKMWDYQVTLTTFIVTFFTAEAYNHWKAVYFTTRAIQGRINDICLLVTLGAEREDVATLTADCPTKHTTGYSPEAAALVDVCTRLIKLSHTFFWASTPTTSDGIGDGGVEDGDHIVEFPAALRSDDAIAPVLLSRVGLEGLVDAGELTKHEKDALIDSGLPPSQYAYVLLEWVGIHIMDGIRQGRLSGGTGFEENILRQVTALRAEYFSIGDYAAGRMPLAYVQLVQVLVDSLVLLASFGLYTELGRLAVPLTGILTLFYKGLLELSKSFLDPFGVEGYPAQNIRVDVLVSELNFGAASRWVKSGAVLPSYQKADHKSTSCD